MIKFTHNILLRLLSPKKGYAKLLKQRSIIYGLLLILFLATFLPLTFLRVALDSEPYPRMPFSHIQGPSAAVSQLPTGVQLYYINHDDAKDRRHVMEVLLSNWQNLTRISGISPRDLHKHATNKTNAGLQRCSPTAKAECARLASHLKCITSAGEQGSPVVLIMDDDISNSWAPYWKYDVEQLARSIIEPWDVILLQYELPLGHHEKLIREWREDPRRLFCRLLPLVPVRSGAYLINQNGMKMLREKYYDESGNLLREAKGCECAPSPSWFEELKAFLVTPPLFSRRISAMPLDQPERQQSYGLALHQSVVSDMQWVVQEFELRAQLLGAQEPARPRFLTPLTKWQVVRDTNALFFMVHRLLFALKLAYSR